MFPSLTLPDLTPNTGLWWYFFTEMFDHFRPFFLMVFSVTYSFLLFTPAVFLTIITRSISLSTSHLSASNSSNYPIFNSWFSSEKIRYDPLYAAFLLIGVLGIFKAYPTLSDPGLFLSMIVLFPEIYPCNVLLPDISSDSLTTRIYRLSPSNRHLPPSPSCFPSHAIVQPPLASSRNGKRQLLLRVDFGICLLQRSCAN